MFIYFPSQKFEMGREADSCPCCELAEQSGRQAERRRKEEAEDE